MIGSVVHSNIFRPVLLPSCSNRFRRSKLPEVRKCDFCVETGRVQRRVGEGGGGATSEDLWWPHGSGGRMSLLLVRPPGLSFIRVLDLVIMVFCCGPVPQIWDKSVEHCSMSPLLRRRRVRSQHFWTSQKLLPPRNDLSQNVWIRRPGRFSSPRPAIAAGLVQSPTCVSVEMQSSDPWFTQEGTPLPGKAVRFETTN